MRRGLLAGWLVCFGLLASSCGNDGRPDYTGLFAGPLDDGGTLTGPGIVFLRIPDNSPPRSPSGSPFTGSFCWVFGPTQDPHLNTPGQLRGEELRGELDLFLLPDHPRSCGLQVTAERSSTDVITGHYASFNCFVTSVRNINSATTSIEMNDASVLPAAGAFIFEDETEIISYTGKSGNMLTGVVRGANGTTAMSHCAYKVVRLEVASGQFERVEISQTGVVEVTRDTSGLPLPGECVLRPRVFGARNLSSTATQIRLNTTAGLPAMGRIQIEDELIDYISKNPDTTLTASMRGAGGTVAASHCPDTDVVLVP